MSAPQHIGVGAPTGRLAGVGSRRVGSPANCRWGADRSAVWRSGADLSAPQQIVVGEPTGRFPRTLPLGARLVGSLESRHCLSRLSRKPAMAACSIVRMRLGYMTSAVIRTLRRYAWCPWLSITDAAIPFIATVRLRYFQHKTLAGRNCRASKQPV